MSKGYNTTDKQGSAIDVKGKCVGTGEYKKAWEDIQNNLRHGKCITIKPPIKPTSIHPATPYP